MEKGVEQGTKRQVGGRQWRRHGKRDEGRGRGGRGEGQGCIRRGGGGGSEGGGEGGSGWEPPSSFGPPMVPAEGGPKSLKRLEASSWHRRG